MTTATNINAAAGFGNSIHNWIRANIQLNGRSTQDIAAMVLITCGVVWLCKQTIGLISHAYDVWKSIRSCPSFWFWFVAVNGLIFVLVDWKLVAREVVTACGGTLLRSIVKQLVDIQSNDTNVSTDDTSDTT